jgi:methanol--5-hydroxybenzimidazolylcobamide Co-methyltransferase
LRDLHADSDSRLDPQAYVLRPDVVLEISKELVKVNGYYARTKKAAELAFKHMQKGFDNKELDLSDKEQSWLEKLAGDVADLPADVNELTAYIIGDCAKLDPKKYDLKF